MNNKPRLQGTIDVIYRVIQNIGPASARDIERHIEVVQACRSSKLKARRLIDRLHKLGYVKSDQARQMPKFSVSG
jgi:Mn-dependent DtxR family transcriptional regulator